MSDLAISTQGLVKVYSQVRAVDGLNLNVPRGAVYGFLGRNGAGKTTTIKTLLGLARPTAGAAQVLGLDIVRDRIEILRRVAFVGENKALYDGLTATEMLRFTRAFYPKWSGEAAEMCAQRLEIPMTQKFAKLSKGNRAKVWLLLAMGQNAELMLLDEPTAGLDPFMNDALLKLLAEEYAAEGRTVFFSSHHLAEVEQICDWVGIMDEGRMLLEARLEDIREHYRLVIAAGRDLPATASAPVVTITRNGEFSRYLLARGAETFAAGLKSQGAAVTHVTPLNLREVFVELVRKEEACTSGNVGETHAVPFLSF
jgi:ABC-2 type transport system ATP-binding protein